MVSQWSQIDYIFTVLTPQTVPNLKWIALDEAYSSRVAKFELLEKADLGTLYTKYYNVRSERTQWPIKMQ